MTRTTPRRQQLYAYEPAVSNAPTYAIKSGGDTQVIAVSNTEVYFGGHFRNITTFKLSAAREN